MRSFKTISFVVPVYNEEGNIQAFFDELDDVARALGANYEIVFVNDGSTDRSLEIISELSVVSDFVKFISFGKNCGQSAALAAGFKAACGDVIITLDADMQNDPHDIPSMLKLYGDYDMVTGWRRRRDDTMSKKIASRIGNFFRNLVTRDNIHDTGCSLKVMRASMLKQIQMYKGLHRFLPTLMRLQGARVAEIEVHHRARVSGKSKYTNLRRGVEGLYDLLAVRWMIKRNLFVSRKEGI